VRALPAPAVGSRIKYDSEVTGFGVRMTSAGARSFVLNYRVAGRERRYTIGSFPDWTAREEAKALKRRIDHGEDPIAERQADRAHRRSRVFRLVTWPSTQLGSASEAPRRMRL
jgi:Arm domain-containing DNA-binding protein